ncbi:MAG: phosphatidylinositol-specific phospholipase C/glycerophosphodiester phosphodiesterase family protein [Tannerella sp.]|jgi:alkaline phosphatase|nr:phosphatidylinositol-specific phospholipase C/glycerophosphodiester phosphodiesterase family protein [Tannerella sp.]
MKSRQYCKALLRETDRRLREKNRKFLFFASVVCFLFCHCVQAQQILIHSHNDYQQPVPFYKAYGCRVYSIEVDIFHSGTDGLLVAHEVSGLSTARTFEDLYLGPIVELFRLNKGQAWKESGGTFQLLIDIKTPVVPTLDILVSKLNAYPEVFDAAVNIHAVRIVISGDRPVPSEFSGYPPYIFFDGDLRQTYTPEQLRRVALFSEPFDRYSKWDGKEGYIIDSEKTLLEEAIRRVHSMGKQIRFWGTPDNMTAWRVFHTLGVDYINTDRPEACVDFFSRISGRGYR